MGVLPPSSCATSLSRGAKARQPAMTRRRLAGTGRNVWLCAVAFLYTMRGILRWRGDNELCFRQVHNLCGTEWTVIPRSDGDGLVVLRGFCGFPRIRKICGSCGLISVVDHWITRATDSCKR